MCAQVKHIADLSTQAFGVNFSCLSQALKPLHLFPTQVMLIPKFLKLYLITYYNGLYNILIKYYAHHFRTK